MLTVNDEIFSARDVFKSSTHFVNAFSAPNYGILGYIDVDQVLFYRKPEIRERYDVENIDTRVELLKVYSGMGKEFIEYAVKLKVSGLIIEAFGRGNVPPEVKEGIAHAIENNIPVIITSRVPNGRVLPIYGYNGSGKDLLNIGAIMGSDLNGEKARIKLMVLLGAKKSIEEIRECFKYENLLRFK